MDAEKVVLASKVADLYGRKTLELLPMCVGALKVLKLMADDEWHTADELHKVVSVGKPRQQDGTRRIREIRQYGFVVLTKKVPVENIGIVWYYKVAKNSQDQPLEGEIVKCQSKSSRNSIADSSSEPPRILVLDSSQYEVK